MTDTAPPSTYTARMSLLRTSYTALARRCQRRGLLDGKIGLLDTSHKTAPPSIYAARMSRSGLLRILCARPSRPYFDWKVNAFYRAQSSTRTTRLRRLCLSILLHTDAELLLHLQSSLEAVRCCSAIVLLGARWGMLGRTNARLELCGLLSYDLQAWNRFPSSTSHANSPRLCTKDISEPGCQPVLHRFMWSDTARSDGAPEYYPATPA
ncbi:hypothetical protein B0H16DRAFT_1809317 [Mycena metata]|uniref:Uncharacterized protein n=1 Tax=Mycena metata TaxID=1033252 RepID=A0AAD7H7H8_9AGAR|nr:hypothetical protein B0H16DRAFT_1809317 [Mycena metata]